MLQTDLGCDSIMMDMTINYSIANDSFVACDNVFGMAIFTIRQEYI